MNLFAVASTIVVLAALFGYVNVRFLRLPNAIGLMVITIAATMLLAGSAWVNPQLLAAARDWVAQIDFEYVLLDVLLGFLLFAGALHTNFRSLHVYRWPVLIFATIGVLVSTLITTLLVYFAFDWIGMGIPFLHCLLFGALISPTDPIAVMGILRKAEVPKSLEIKIVGESLFNDGMGVVVFISILSIAAASPHSLGEGAAAAQAAEHTVGWLPVIGLLLQEVFGGIGIGLALGYVTYWMMKSVDDYEIEVMITLACVMGGSTLAHYLHVSAPLAMVVAGLFVGSETVRGRSMSELTEQYVDKFWELTDVLLNVVLFVLIGLEVLIIAIDGDSLIAASAAIGIVLLSRFISLSVPIRFFRKRLDFAPYTTTIMTWGGLRGGISIALALSLPADLNRSFILTVTYAVVIFSILVQGLTVGPIARRLLGRARSATAVASV